MKEKPKLFLKCKIGAHLEINYISSGYVVFIRVVI
jgi:hypothetical protein